MMTNEQVVAELGWTRKAIQAVLGVTPTTMRPPFGDIGMKRRVSLRAPGLITSTDNRVRAIANAMGLKPIIWTRTSNVTFDTNGTYTSAWHFQALTVRNQTGVLRTAPTLDRNSFPFLRTCLAMLHSSTQGE